MNIRTMPNVLIILVTSIFGSCVQETHENNINRSFFTIGSTLHLEMTLYLNDSIPANLIFDTGGALVLDSAFCADHPSILKNISIIPDTIVTGSSWSTYLTTALRYKDISQKAIIGKTKTQYSIMNLYNWRKYNFEPHSDGMFNIPQNDTSHVWELNFTHNYLEIHEAKEFKMPNDALVFPLILVTTKNFYSAIGIQMPIQITCSDGATITINRNLWIDTGMSKDIALIYSSEISDFFNKRDDGVWYGNANALFRCFKVSAALSGKLIIDTLYLYTFDNNYKSRLNKGNVIGLNFLKRFNVFFDMKNKRLGLQPVNNFQRINDPARRAHFNVQLDSNGKYRIAKMLNYKENYFKTAGLQVGDEIIQVNNIPYKTLSFELWYKLKNRDIIVFDIIRNGKALKIIVKK